MNTYRSPFVFLSASLVVVLALVGVAFGLWSETLTINGTVATGSVDAEWTSCVCFDQGVDPNAPEGVTPKDVGSTACSIDEQDPGILHVVVNNGYPSYWNDCEVEYSNVGTVPYIVQGWRITPHNFDLASANGAGDGEIWVDQADGVGTQVEPCPDPACTQAGSLKFHVEQPAEENFTYDFDVQVCVSQWNEPATLNECFVAAPQ